MPSKVEFTLTVNAGQLRAELAAVRAELTRLEATGRAGSLVGGADRDVARIGQLRAEVKRLTEDLARLEAGTGRAPAAGRGPAGAADQVGGGLERQLRGGSAAVRALAVPVAAELAPALGTGASRISSMLAASASLGGGLASLTLVVGGLAAVVGGALVEAYTKAKEAKEKFAKASTSLDTGEITAAREEARKELQAVNEQLTALQALQARRRQAGVAPNVFVGAQATGQQEARTEAIRKLDVLKRQLEIALDPLGSETGLAQATAANERQEAKTAEEALDRDKETIANRVKLLNLDKAIALSRIATAREVLADERQHTLAPEQRLALETHLIEQVRDVELRAIDETAKQRKDAVALSLAPVETQALQRTQIDAEAARERRVAEDKYAKERRQAELAHHALTRRLDDEAFAHRRALLLTTVAEERARLEQIAGDTSTTRVGGLAVPNRTVQERRQAAQDLFQLDRSRQEAGGSVLQSAFGLQRVLNPGAEQRLAEIRADALAPRFSLAGTTQAIEQAQALVERHQKTLDAGGSLSASDADKFSQAQSFLNRFEDARRGRSVEETVRDSFHEFTSPVRPLEVAATTFSGSVDRFGAIVGSLEGREALPDVLGRRAPSEGDRSPALAARFTPEAVERAREIVERHRETLAAGGTLSAGDADQLAGARGFLEQFEAAQSAQAGRLSGPMDRFDSATRMFSAAVDRFALSGQAQRPVAPGEPAASIPQYETGTPFVPRTEIALVHRGERITPAEDNERIRRLLAMAEVPRTAPPAETWPGVRLVPRTVPGEPAERVPGVRLVPGGLPGTPAPLADLPTDSAGLAERARVAPTPRLVDAFERASFAAGRLESFDRGGSGEPWSPANMAAFERFTGQRATRSLSIGVSGAGLNRLTLPELQIRRASLEAGGSGGFRELRQGPEYAREVARLRQGAGGGASPAGRTRAPSGLELGDRIDLEGIASGATGTRGGTLRLEGGTLRQRFDAFERPSRGTGLLRPTGGLWTQPAADRAEFEGIASGATGTRGGTLRLEGQPLRNRFADFERPDGRTALLATTGGQREAFEPTFNVPEPVSLSAGDLRRAAPDGRASAREDWAQIRKQIRGAGGTSPASTGLERDEMPSVFQQYRRELATIMASELPGLIQRERARR